MLDLFMELSGITVTNHLQLGLFKIAGMLFPSTITTVAWGLDRNYSE